MHHVECDLAVAGFVRFDVGSLVVGYIAGIPPFVVRLVRGVVRAKDVRPVGAVYLRR